jgi:lipopolysaccharide transport system ATP-binding protein
VRYESKGARIEDPRLTMTDGGPVNLLRSGELYVWRYRVVFDRRFTNVRFGMMIKTLTGMDVGGRTTTAFGEGVGLIEPGTRSEVLFSFRAHLAPGTYFLNAGVVAILPEGETYLDRWIEAAIFKVLPDGEPWVTGFVDFGIEAEVRLEGRPVSIS